jgi:hypothetical protein
MDWHWHPFGFFFWLLTAFVFFGVLRALFFRRHHRRAYGRGYGHGRFGAHGCHGDDGFGDRGGGPRGWLRSVFLRLDTTPGQEKAIVAAAEQLKDVARGTKDRAAALRTELAQALRGERLDPLTVEAAFNRQEQALTELKAAAVVTFSKVHEALDERQRRLLADTLERGGSFARGC